MYLIDLLGHGDNTFEKGFGVHDIPFIQQFIQTEIEGDVPLYIVGNSMGAVPAMAIAKANNVEGVILQAPMIRFDQAATAFVREQNAWYSSLLSKQTIHQGVLGALDAQKIAVEETDITLALPDFNKPVLIFASDIDTVSPHNLWKNYENAFLRVVKVAKRPHGLMTLVGQKEHVEIIRWFEMLNSSKTAISRQSLDQIEDMHLSTQIQSDNKAVAHRDESLPD
ncbi:MAG: alpha/beta fold hydrolase [Alteromonadaceae bacterium]|nr:alpha/beta fold hydrolase [Alteromonadaceae bacterium]